MCTQPEMGEQQVRQKWIMELGVQQRKLDAANTRVGAVDAVACRQSTHTWTHAHTHARTNARTQRQPDRQREKERERRPIGEPFESLGGLLCDAAVQLGGAMVWSRTPRTGPLGRCGSAKNIGSLGESPIC